MVTLFLVCLGLLSLWGVRGEVAPNFNNCKEFFFRETPVSGLNIALPTPVEPNTQKLTNPEKCLSAYNAASPAYICQIYNNQYYFATLYDRGRRIPLYSAYKMDIKGEPEREGSIVNYEPQLVHPELSKNQRKKKECLTEIKNYNNIPSNDCKESFPQYRQTYKLGWSQALDDNFGTYDRGHLNPAGHHGKGDASQATMTFTNVAPQNPKMNQVQWNQYEQKLKNDLSQGCSNMYVVTGVVPSTTWVDQNQRVNVPSHYWNAFCCTDNNDKPLRSGGALCPNTDEGVVTEYNTVADLQNVLGNDMSFGSNFNIFFNRCQI
ncbi:endonuclease domain-containing 1 protein-like [Esox lucius]|uniref:Endonuclease domain-containing 1 protein n=1 Tax=Esox lucius TaxID=8010 RepID=A0A6Q2YG57_ESOLU|nr:endonuclease domain-containing 1 protein-like [Esox lucius]